MRLQKDGRTLPRALAAFETALLVLTSMQTTPGENLGKFLEERLDGKFHTVELLHYNQETRNRFDR